MTLYNKSVALVWTYTQFSYLADYFSIALVWLPVVMRVVMGMVSLRLHLLQHEHEVPRGQRLNRERVRAQAVSEIHYLDNNS